MAVKPLITERPPTKPIGPWIQPPDTYRYKVKTGDTWLTLGAQNNHQFGEHHLIWINFSLSGTEHFYTEQVNWYLREYVGCRHSLDGGRNWAFTDDADPGYIFLPFLTYNMDAIAITGKPAVGSVSAPGYSDRNPLDILSKGFDIYGGVDLAVNTLEIPLAALAEGGFIVTGILASAFGGFIAGGAAHNAALKSKSREHFFNGFCSSFVMRADGWSAATVENFYSQRANVPIEAVYAEKRETYRKLYNFGLKAGRLQGSKLNTVDQRNLFRLLRSRLSDAEARDYSGAVKDWSGRKKTLYYDRLGSILKQMMLENDLEIKLR